jgi:hypothetical protein
MFCRKSFIVVIVLQALILVQTARAQDDILKTKITIPRQTASLYETLNLISARSGCLFIYDSQVIENSRRVKLSADNEELLTVLQKILPANQYSFKVIGRHILLYKKEGTVPLVSPVAKLVAIDSIKIISVNGRVIDAETRQALPYVSIGIAGQNIGTIANEDGYFRLKVPAEYAGLQLMVSHIGYEMKQIPLQLIRELKVDIQLSRRVISLQEVIIRYIDPLTILRKALDARSANYNTNPAYITAFYREGTRKNNRYTSYSEAVFKIYKSPYSYSVSADQVKMLKSRKIQNEDPKDTVFVKLKGGVLTALQLDIVKRLPDFLDLSEPLSYKFSYSDVVSYAGRDAYVISFSMLPTEGVIPYTGVLYIDRNDYTILGTEFEVDPSQMDEATAVLVLRKSHNLKVKFEKIRYSISYASFGDTYYLNHVRCDMQIRTRLHHHLNSDQFVTFLEYATCKTDTVNVARFDRQEILRPGMVFSEAPYTGNPDFWDDYNVIAPEKKLSEALDKLMIKLAEAEK